MTHCTTRMSGPRGVHECGKPAERIYLYRRDKWPKCHRCNSAAVRRFAEAEGIESVEVSG